MVAEPVQATMETLSSFYNRTSQFVAEQSDRIKDLDLNHYNPLQVSHKELPSLVEKESIWDKLSGHKYKISILTVGIGLGSYYYYSKRSLRSTGKPKPKRRVPKLANGARQDVVLIVGSPTEPMTRLIALDFERRGFIVYLTILDEKDLKYTESNPITEDINYLNITDSYSFENQISRFNQLLKIPVVPFPGAEAHTLKLVGVVFTPNLYFPIGPIENVTVASWMKILDRLAIYPKLFSSGLINLIRKQKAKTILILPNITSSMNLPYHGPESTFQNALQSLFTTLTREITQHGLSVTQIKLGNISISSNTNSSAKMSNLINFEIKGWNDDIKSLYSRSFSKSQFKSNPIKSTGPGTNLRDLYHLLYDLIYTPKYGPVVYYGTGARAYDWLSRILPVSFLSWILS